MKKLLSIALSCAMISSMTVSSFAAVSNHVIGVDGEALLYSSSLNKFVKLSDEGNAPYGSTVFLKLNGNEDVDADGIADYIKDYDAVKGTSIKVRWEEGSKFVDKVEIVKKKYGSSATDYAYYLSVGLKTGTSTTLSDVVGTITLRKTGNDGFWDNGVSTDDTIDINFGITAGYNYPYESMTINDSYSLFEKDKNNCFTGGDESFYFAGTEHYFDVDTTGQGKFIAKADVTYDSSIANKYSNANLDFFNGYGTTFNRIGTLSIMADPSSYLYEVKSGKLVAVKSTYDKYEEAFKIKTRTIGQYVISDRELNVKESSSSEVIVPSSSSSTVQSSSSNNSTSKPNPNTGVGC